MSSPAFYPKRIWVRSVISTFGALGGHRPCFIYVRFVVLAPLACEIVLIANIRPLVYNQAHPPSRRVITLRSSKYKIKDVYEWPAAFQKTKLDSQSTAVGINWTSP